MPLPAHFLILIPCRYQRFRASLGCLPDAFLAFSRPPSRPVAAASPCQVFTPQHKAEALRYLTNHQNADGGFGLHIEGESTMFGTGLKWVQGGLTAERQRRAGNSSGLHAWCGACVGTCVAMRLGESRCIICTQIRSVFYHKQVG